MSVAFTMLMITTMALALGVLALGILSMARGGDFNRKYGNRLMRGRLILQGLALAFFVLTLLAMKK